jgi:hypothetical protein
MSTRGLVLLIIIVFLSLALVFSQTTSPKKFWYYEEHVSGETSNTYVTFIEDNETGTRCYAIQHF